MDYNKLKNMIEIILEGVVHFVKVSTPNELRRIAEEYYFEKAMELLSGYEEDKEEEGEE